MRNFAGKLIVIEGRGRFRALDANRAAQPLARSEWICRASHGICAVRSLVERGTRGRETRQRPHARRRCRFSTRRISSTNSSTISSPRCAPASSCSRIVTFTRSWRAISCAAPTATGRAISTVPRSIPDAVFYFKVGARPLVERNFQKNATLDYWESGMDLGSVARHVRFVSCGISACWQTEFQRDAQGVRLRGHQRQLDEICSAAPHRIGAMLGIGATVPVPLGLTVGNALDFAWWLREPRRAI